jgi:hypothetical protein
MPSTILSYLLSAPNTSELIAPSKIQQANDFDSTSTSASTETSSSGIHENLDWSRLLGYIATPWLSKRPKLFV